MVVDILLFSGRRDATKPQPHSCGNLKTRTAAESDACIYADTHTRANRCTDTCTYACTDTCTYACTDT